MQQVGDRTEERMTQLQSNQVGQGLQLSRILAADTKAEPDMTDILRNQETKKKESILVEDDGEFYIPVEHSTATKELLMWPSIRALLYPKRHDEDYVMNLEERRGPIRVYGRAEGDDASEGAQGQQQPPYMPNASAYSIPTWNKGYPTAGSISGTWGVLTLATSVETVEHGIEESGIFTTNSDTVRLLYLSYVEHMHKLHPFLDLGDLKKKIEMFICTYCSSVISHSSSGDRLQGAKRRRSMSPVGIPDRAFPLRVELSIDNAIILLVLALGSICECRNHPVPGPLTDRPQDYRKEQIPRQAVPGREASADTQHLRNVDVIPGLAYYGYATRILGGFQGSNGLPHVQAALLAGLYACQLAHPFQSHGWIFQAARACQVLVRSYVFTFFFFPPHFS